MRLAIAALVATVLAAACVQGDDGGPTPSPSPTPAATTPAAPPPTVSLFEDFETGLDAWRADAVVPLDPDRPGMDAAWNVTWTDGAGWEDHVHIVGHPVHSARFCLDGRAGNGTAWLERAVPVQPGATYRVDVSFHAWGETARTNATAHAVLQVGSLDPEVEADFPPANTTGRHGTGGGLRAALGEAGWTAHAANFTFEATGETAWVALGLSVVAAEEACHPLDALDLTMAPV